MGRHSRMRKAKLASAVIVGLLMGVPGRSRADEPVIPKVAPRPASTLVMLPDGSTLHVELARTSAEQAYGLMDRSSLPEGRGMLFLHDHSGEFPYWMYHCKIALDIVWMDDRHRVVEVSAKTPPCRGLANTCPSYGGHTEARYVLELPPGSAARHAIVTSSVINFNAE